MNTFLIGMAQAMIDNWDRNGITGNGVTQMEFFVDKNGSIVGKKLYKYSGNKTLDNSVNKLISTFDKYQIPPSSYDYYYFIQRKERLNESILPERQSSLIKPNKKKYEKARFIGLFFNCH